MSAFPESSNFSPSHTIEHVEFLTKGAGETSSGYTVSCRLPFHMLHLEE